MKIKSRRKLENPGSCKTVLPRAVNVVHWFFGFFFHNVPFGCWEKARKEETKKKDGIPHKPQPIQAFSSFPTLSQQPNEQEIPRKKTELVPESPDSSFPDGKTFPDPKPKKSLSIPKETRIKFDKIQAPKESYKAYKKDAAFATERMACWFAYEPILEKKLASYWSSEKENS